MTEAITTVADAAGTPTPPGPLTQRQAEPTRHDGSPRPGLIADNTYDRLEPAEREKYARVRKGPEGGSEWVHRDQLGKEPVDPAKPGTTAAPSDATVTADGRLQVGEMLLSQDDIATLIADKAQADLRKTQVPDKPESYAAELPKEFKLPEGMTWQFDTNSPAYVDARAWAHRNGLSQSQWSEALSFFASTQIAEQQMVGRAAQIEVEKLGAHGTARVTAVDTWLRGTLGDDLGKAVRGMMLTAKAVEGIEKLMTKMSTQGHASFRQDGREVDRGGKGPLSSMSDEAYAATSANERFRLSRLGN
jgi:hypothetical protein